MTTFLAFTTGLLLGLTLSAVAYGVCVTIYGVELLNELNELKEAKKSEED